MSCFVDLRYAMFIEHAYLYKYCIGIFLTLEFAKQYKEVFPEASQSDINQAYENELQAQRQSREHQNAVERMRHQQRMEEFKAQEPVKVEELKTKQTVEALKTQQIQFETQQLQLLATSSKPHLTHFI